MGLAEKLASRASARGATAQVDCGELGTVTVEALPLRELELLSRSPDGARKVFYAACRELQAAGEQMRREGKVYTPDGILEFVSGREANAAFAQVAALSGADSGKLSEVRLSSVQETSGKMGEIRPSSVQETAGPEPGAAAADGENRPEAVQMDQGDAPTFGQVSRETGAEIADFPKGPESDNKTPSMGEFLPGQAQNVVSGENFVESSGSVSGGTATALHETESDSGSGMHEMKSDFGANARLGLHEIKPAFGGGLHETESESRGKRRSALHETESDSGKSLHETESESPEMLHEMGSELAERTARALLAGLQRAKWVRGG